MKHSILFAIAALVLPACGDKDGTDDSSVDVEVDSDGDGFTEDVDCDDNDVGAYPGAAEVCDGLDNNCDGEIDEGTLLTAWMDADDDGFGDAATMVQVCALEPGQVDNDLDCDDSDPGVSPDGDEVCDGQDNNCDGETDEDSALDASTWYADLDGDGFGDPDSVTQACEASQGYTDDSTDCDDGDALISPDGVEICDDIDNDCDGLVDWGHRVPSDFSTIQDAIDGAPDNSTLCVESGTHAGLFDFSGKDMRLVGTWGSANTTLDGELAGSIAAAVSGETIELHGFTLRNGLSNFGAAIELSEATATLSDLDIRDNACAEASGNCHGVLSAQDSTLTLTDSVVAENTGVSDQGRVWGVGMRLVRSNSTLEGVSVLDNEGSTYRRGTRGVGVAVREGSASMTDVLISGNLADSDVDSKGTGIYADSGAVIVLDGVQVDDNESLSGGDTFGGGGHFQDSTVSITSSSFDGNLSESGDEGRGGGASFMDCDASVSIASFDGNDAQAQATIVGGGLYVSGALTSSTSSSFEDITVSDNAMQSGELLTGALQLLEADPSFSRVFLHRNVATSDVCIESPALFTADSSSSWTNLGVVGNSAFAAMGVFAGGVRIIGGAPILTSFVVAGNDSTGDAGNVVSGGVSLDETNDAQLTNGSITGNHTDTGNTCYALGLHTRNGATVAVTNTDVSDNTWSRCRQSSPRSGVRQNSGSITMVNSNVHGHEFDQYSSMTDPTGSDGNISVAPGYADTSSADPTLWDLTLSSSSALIDAGNSSILDSDGSTSDIGAYGGPNGGSW